MNKGINEMLLNPGIMPNTKGYDYLALAIETQARMVSNLRMQEIEAYIAREYNTKISSVDRCIRYAIGTINEDSEARRKYLPFGKRTVSVVVHVLANEVKEKENNRNA